MVQPIMFLLTAMLGVKLKSLGISTARIVGFVGVMQWAASESINTSSSGNCVGRQ